jgi:lipopolysaccharide transport system permease protein
MFLSPIFYSTKSLSPSIQSWMFLNPLAPVIENVRLVVFVGEMPDWSHWALSLGVSLLGALLGSAFFQATRREFSDVLDELAICAGGEQSLPRTTAQLIV